MIVMMPRKLTHKQVKFVKLMANGIAQGKAAAFAGYVAPEQEAWRLLRVPAVTQAISEAVERRIMTEGATLGFRVLVDLAKGGKAENVRFQAAKTLLQAAGHLADKGKLAPDAAKQETTIQDLEAMQKMIADRKADLEGEIRDVTPLNADILSISEGGYHNSL